MNSRNIDQVKSGYFLVFIFSKISLGGFTTLFFFGHKKNAIDFLALSLFTTALCKQLLNIPFDRAYKTKIDQSFVYWVTRMCILFRWLFRKYHESVTDIDNESLGIWENGSPLIVNKDLKAIDMVLMKDGQRARITMRSCT